MNTQNTHNGQMEGKEFDGLDEITKALYETEGRDAVSEQFIEDIERTAEQYNMQLHMEYEYNICITNGISDFGYMMPVIYGIKGHEKKRLGELSIEGQEKLYN